MSGPAAMGGVESAALDAEEALATLANGSRSFHFAGLFLPADRRADAARLYAFCRHVDDVADEAPDADEAREALDGLRAELRRERPPRAIVQTLFAVAARRGVDLRAADELIAGVRSDLDVVRLRDDRDLIRYCYQVASTVGLMMCGVLGVKEDEALPHAIDLGIAMQLTNICRDVRADAEMGRVYLPATRLRAAGVGVEPGEVLAGRDGVPRVVADLLDLAEQYYASADAGMRFIPWRARFAILTASRVYRAIGLRLRRGGSDALAGRTVVPWWEKGGWAIVACGVWARSAWRTAPHRPELHRALDGMPGADVPAEG